MKDTNTVTSFTNRQSGIGDQFIQSFMKPNCWGSQWHFGATKVYTLLVKKY